MSNIKSVLIGHTQAENTAVIVVDVLSNKYVALHFEGVEDGCGGYDLKVWHSHYPDIELDKDTVGKIEVDVALIKDTIGTTTKVKIWGQKPQRG